jgi:hypothetical protein
MTTGKFSKMTLLDEGKFFGISPALVLSKKKSISEVVDRLKRFNVWLEAGVKKMGDQLVITESTVLKSYE